MKAFFLAGITLVIIVTASQLAVSQTSASTVSQKDAERIAKVKKDVAKIGIGKGITVSRLDNRDFFGVVRTIGTDDFEVIETDTSQVQIFKYIDIKNVRSGDGQVSKFTGKRSNSRLKRIIGFVSAAVLVTIIVVVVRGLSDRDF